MRVAYENRYYKIKDKFLQHVNFTTKSKNTKPEKTLLVLKVIRFIPGISVLILILDNTKG